MAEKAVKDKLIELLETFEYPVRLQGSLSPTEAYPASFFTYWNNSTYDRAHYDNEPLDYVWSFTVYFYSADPSLVNTVPLEAVDLLRQNGWTISGRGYDVPSDEISHTGRAFDALYIENNYGG